MESENVAKDGPIWILHHGKYGYVSNLWPAVTWTPTYKDAKCMMKSYANQLTVKDRGRELTRDESDLADCIILVSPIHGEPGPFSDDEPEEKKSSKGFASFTPEQRRICGSKGGKKAHETGHAHRFTSESAKVAGKIPHTRGTAYKWTKEEAIEAGRKGGVKRQAKRAARIEEMEKKKFIDVDKLENRKVNGQSKR